MTNEEIEKQQELILKAYKEGFLDGFRGAIELKPDNSDYVDIKRSIPDSIPSNVGEIIPWTSASPRYSIYTTNNTINTGNITSD